MKWDQVGQVGHGISTALHYGHLLAPGKVYDFAISTPMHNRFTLENYCTRTVQSSRGGCSLQVHKIEHLAVNKGNILVLFLLLKILIVNYYHF